MKRFYSNGKLLLTGEYAVLDGALSLAVPTKYGQSLIVETIDEPKIIWKSIDKKGEVWFEDEFSIEEIATSNTPCNDVRERLVQILNAAKQLNSEFLSDNKGFKVTTELDFPKKWGLGTSSTLINNISQWAEVDAYMLLENTFGGSGYDIACAQHNTPIIYQIKNRKPEVQEVNFNPSYREHLYFVHLNKKQNSRDGIKYYHENKEHSKYAISKINQITKKMANCNALKDFENLIISHENIISKLTKQTPVKDLLFPDFEGCIKSLGAWGGDFILVTSTENPSSYFKQKGFETIIPYKDMVL
ncbi:GYDIA family GHMP kinase [Flaviramulus sp. BrNp1-15]|uniref:GYDIA family GHMP kinase n=1 Tax=Flaviramulus sp. BrNp1-15 TaxID=2916754 RepID=UPI001EE96FEB|nr:GYDIA family GHMP kinase [Flaviramulus sp. BrNp1-15]ULC60369.1 GYDIA family GHMP kinase [Flaviramulus sp. BrNp1-15]